MFMLPDCCSVIQADITVIKQVVDTLLNSVTSVREVSIYSDSQMAISALYALVVSMRLVRKCLTSLSNALGYFLIRLIWVPRHSDIAGNVATDQGDAGDTSVLL